MKQAIWEEAMSGQEREWWRQHRKRQATIQQEARRYLGFGYVRKHDVEQGGHYDARSAAIIFWSHRWLDDATRMES